MNKYLLIISIIATIVGCEQSGGSSIAGEKISISYSDLDSIMSEDYIIIDNIKFQHSPNSEDWSNENLYPPDEEDANYELLGYLPTSKTMRFSSIHNREFMERWNPFAVARLFAKKLSVAGYKIEDPIKLSISGELVFSSNEPGKSIQVIYSDKYPAQINITE